MTPSNQASRRAVWLSAWLVGSAAAQTSAAMSSQADGLTMTAGSASATLGTVTVDGSPTTFRVIETLPASIDETAPILANVNDPEAVNAQHVCPGYTASNVVDHAYGFSADLTLAGEPCSAYGNDIEDLRLSVQYQNADRLNVRIQPAYLTSANMSQYLVPTQYVYQPTVDSDANATSSTNDLQYVWTNEPSFGFAVLRKSTGETLFDTRGTKLVFEDQFLEFASVLPPDYNLYGLGETIHGLRLSNNFTETMWAADVGDVIDANIYGSHAFYLDTRYYEIDRVTGNETYVSVDDFDTATDYISRSHGVYLRSTHGQEILLRAENITWRTIGGSIDLYFLAGPDQKSVTKQYQQGIIGMPAMQKYDVFGFHQCRWGYANWTEMQDVIDNFRNFDIPLEYIWNDIDYMYAYRNWENDPIRFAYDEGKHFLDRLHASGQNYVPIIDAAIYHPNPFNATDAYAPWARGNATNSYMTNPDGSTYIGSVWPGFTVFPDWRANGTADWWTGEFEEYYRQIPYDGIWLDMNEASSFCVGSCGTGRLRENQVHPPFALPGEQGAVVINYPEGFNLTNATEATAASSASSSQAAQQSATATSQSGSTMYVRTTPTPGVRSTEMPPYELNNYNGALGVHGLSGNATHADGIADYDIHNIWGYEETIATYNALYKIFDGARPFIISRSTFAGSGKYTGHWGGDNKSNFFYMYFSISQALSMSLFGIPFFGVDTCGFDGNTSEELCSRWMQLSAFFPFYRNHNTLTGLSQEPYRWASVTEATKTAITIRYSLLPYMYSLFYEAHTAGETVMRALAWEFPNEPNLANVETQFLLGPSLLVTPVLGPGMTTVQGIFPGLSSGTVWYDWYNQTAVTAAAGVNTTLDAPLGKINLHVRGGSILPMQLPGYTIAESRRNPWSLIVALDPAGAATGHLYLDDGVSVSPNATRLIDMTAKGGNSLFASGRGLFQDTNALQNVTVLGVKQTPSNVTFNGSPVSGMAYNDTSKALSITGLGGATAGGAWNSDWSLTWS